MFNFSLAICALFLILVLRFSKDRRYMRLKYKIAAADIGQMRKTPEMFWNNGTLGVIYTHLCHPYQGIRSFPTVLRGEQASHQEHVRSFQLRDNN